MSEPRKHHYVPQVYLRNFLSKDEGSSQIYVLSVSPRKIYCSSIRDIAAERDFYTIPNADDKYKWENYYAQQVEPDMGSKLHSIRQRCESVLIQNNIVVLTAEDKENLARIITVQLLRGNQSRNYQKRIYNDILPQAIDYAKKIFLFEKRTKEEIMASYNKTEDFFKQVSMDATTNENRIKRISSFLLQGTFLLFRIIGDESFVTSDNPPIFMNTITGNTTPFVNGIKKPTTVVYYPISPKLLVAIVHPNFLSGLLCGRDGTLTFIDSQEEKSFIHQINMKQREQCHRCVFAQSRDTLEIL